MVIKIQLLKELEIRAVARPWRERHLPRAPDLREGKK
jgi:hypothetical protein